MYYKCDCSCHIIIHNYNIHLIVGGIDYKPMYASHQFMLNMDQISYCVELNTSDDGSVNSNKTFQLILKSSDDAVNISLSLVTVVIMDDDGQ